MNIHESMLQPIATFVYCDCQAAAGRRQQAKDGNFHTPAGACTTELHPWAEFSENYFMMEPLVKENNFRTVDRRCLLVSEIILFQHGTVSEIILKNFSIYFNMEPRLK